MDIKKSMFAESNKKEIAAVRESFDDKKVPEDGFVKKAFANEDGRAIETPEEVSVLEVEDLTALTTEQCNSLKAGDTVLKTDSTGTHAYKVSFFKEGTGMCITYTDASVVETVSYDFTEGEWVYNSTDSTPIGQ